MEARDTEADFAIAFEAAARCEESEAWWAEGIGGGKRYAAVIEPVFEGGRSGRTAQGEVPFEDVVLKGMGGVVCGWVLGQFSGFFHFGRLARVFVSLDENSLLMRFMVGDFELKEPTVDMVAVMR